MTVPPRRDAILRLAASAAVALGSVRTRAFAAVADASERLLPTTADLGASLAQALARGEPLIVLATLRGCAFCKLARENYLVPEMRAGRAVTQIHFLSRDPVIGLGGQATTHGALVRQLGIEVAPTVLFLGRDSREVAPRLAGGSSSDFYAAYLDDRVAQARTAVRG